MKSFNSPPSPKKTPEKQESRPSPVNPNSKIHNNPNRNKAIEAAQADFVKRKEEKAAGNTRKSRLRPASKKYGPKKGTLEKQAQAIAHDPWVQASELPAFSAGNDSYGAVDYVPQAGAGEESGVDLVPQEAIPAEKHPAPSTGFVLVPGTDFVLKNNDENIKPPGRDIIVRDKGSELAPLVRPVHEESNQSKIETHPAKEDLLNQTLEHGPLLREKLSKKEWWETLSAVVAKFGPHKKTNAETQPQPKTESKEKKKTIMERILAFFGMLRGRNKARAEKLGPAQKSVHDTIMAKSFKGKKRDLLALGLAIASGPAPLGVGIDALQQLKPINQQPTAERKLPGLDAIKKGPQASMERPIVQIPGAKFELKEGQGAGELIYQMQQSLKHVSGIENTDFGKMLLHKDPNLLAEQLGFPLNNAQGYMQPGDSLEFNGTSLIFHRVDKHRGPQDVTILQVEKGATHVVTHREQLREKLGVHMPQGAEIKWGQGTAAYRTAAAATTETPAAAPSPREVPPAPTPAPVVATAPATMPESPYHVRSMSVKYKTENVPPAAPANDTSEAAANAETARANQEQVAGHPIPETASTRPTNPLSIDPNEIAARLDREQTEGKPAFPSQSPFNPTETVTQAPAASASVLETAAAPATSAEASATSGIPSIDAMRESSTWKTFKGAPATDVLDQPGSSNPSDPSNAFRMDLFKVLCASGITPNGGETSEAYVQRAQEAIANHQSDPASVYQVSDTEFVVRGGDDQSERYLANFLLQQYAAGNDSVKVIIQGKSSNYVSYYTSAINGGTFNHLDPYPGKIPSVTGAKEIF